jgi:hypothetical protein
MKNYFLILTGAILCCCTDRQENEAASPAVRPEQLHGQWRNVYMKLEMRTYKNADSTRMLEVNENNWEQVMKIKPIRTFFWYDGTYNSEHRDLRDSIFYNPAGKWTLRADTLEMTDTFPKAGLRYKYRITVNGNMAEFSGVEDLDGDGKKDDLYYGTQRRWR